MDLAAGIQLYILCIIRYEVSGVFGVYNSCNLRDSETDYGADQKFADQKEKIKTYKKSIMLLALLLDFGMLAVLKYTNFTISNINTLFHADIRMVKFLLPLGISFYTFQSVGYILDVYWKRYEPEKNIFKFALFVSFYNGLIN